METVVKSCSEDSCLAFDLLNADDPSGSDCPLTSRSRRRPVSKSCDSDTLAASQRTSLPPIRQRLLRSIHHELSLLAAEADGVSEKVKVGLVCLMKRFRKYVPQSNHRFNSIFLLENTARYFIPGIEYLLRAGLVLCCTGTCESCRCKRAHRGAAQGNCRGEQFPCFFFASLRASSACIPPGAVIASLTPPAGRNLCAPLLHFIVAYFFVLY